MGENGKETREVDEKFVGERREGPVCYYYRNRQSRSWQTWYSIWIILTLNNSTMTPHHRNGSLRRKSASGVAMTLTFDLSFLAMTTYAAITCEKFHSLSEDVALCEILVCDSGRTTQKQKPLATYWLRRRLIIATCFSRWYYQVPTVYNKKSRSYGN